MTADKSQLVAWLEQLLHGETPAIRAEAADRLASARTEVSSDFTFTVHDEYWRELGEIGGDLLEASGTDPRNKVPSATIKSKGMGVLVPALMDCNEKLRGITVETGGIRMSYYVDVHEWEWDKDAWTSTANCLGIWDILNYMQIWPMWFMPIEVQVFSAAIFVGPLVSVIENMIAECAIRIQSGINQFVNQFGSLNPDTRNWFTDTLLSNPNIGQRLKTPMYVVRTNPALDTSPLFAKTVRMQSCGKVIMEITQPYGVDVSVDLWKPGDAQPDQYANLTQPTYVVRVKDRSQVEGPHKNILDSVIRTVVDVQGSFGLSEVLAPLLNPQGQYSPQGVYIAPRLGLNFVMPYALVVAPEPGEKTSLVSCKIADHTPKGWRVIIGGKSPKWLNDIINAAFQWLIDAVMILIGITGVPSSLLDGFLNDSFLAFQLIDNFDRRHRVGPYHPAIEVFVGTGASPYNIEALFTFIEAFWDTRGYTAGVFKFRNNAQSPYRLGVDIFRGGLVSLAYMSRTRLYTDYVENIMWRVTDKDREVMVNVGDGKALEAPLAKVQRYVTGLQEAMHVLSLAPNS